MQASDELARARLAFVSAGQPPLCAPRRALREALEPSDAPVEGLPPPRKLTRKHLVVIAVLLLCGVGVAVTAMGRSAATEVPVVTPVVAPPPPPPSPSEPDRLRVHVAGAVASPGVVTLPEGSIVQDAIGAAGGLSVDANPADLNLAQAVSEGMQIIIGTDAEPAGDVTAAGNGAGVTGSVRLNLNRATVAELETLPGVGPVMAAAIVAWRDEHGKFTVVEELQEVSGIGPKTFDKLRPLVEAG